MNKKPPRVSIGMPVYNGERFIREALDSILAQTFTDFELIISDNASTDRTEEICREYARDDKRIHYVRNETNLGSVKNFNKVFRLATGKYFKWAGTDDWLAPQYIERCVEVLDNEPSVILVTCHEKHVDDEGHWFSYGYDGFKINSLKPHKRFRQMLWCRVGDPYYNVDLIYSLMRRNALRRTNLFRSMVKTHIILGLELSLLGPFRHIPEYLAFRKKRWGLSNVEALRRYDPTQRDSRALLTQFCWTAGAIVCSSSLTPLQKASCLVSILGFYLRESPRRLWGLGRSTVALRTRLRALRATAFRKLRQKPVEGPTVQDTPRGQS